MKINKGCPYMIKQDAKFCTYWHEVADCTKCTYRKLNRKTTLALAEELDKFQFDGEGRCISLATFTLDKLIRAAIAVRRELEC